MTVEAVVEVAVDVHTVRARLANGHRFIACAPRGARGGWVGPAVGDWVWVRFSPCDLSRGWIIQESEVKQ